MQIEEIVTSVKQKQDITWEEFSYILHMQEEYCDILFAAARETSREHFGNTIYLRGLIEISNYCKNDCYYCGIRRSNNMVERYRLTKDDIMACSDLGYSLGFRTFVMQGGEDSYYRDDLLVDILQTMKSKYPDCAVTLSLGERSYESYKRLWEAGADRYLLRHETADRKHYETLHPGTMSWENRKRCLYQLKEIGYQVGCGMMVGSPYQTDEHLYKDIQFMKELMPHMIGIGPFMVHEDTPFANCKNGSVDITLRLLALLRLLFPPVLLPATTALGTADNKGREKGILAGANVLMPNLSPIEVRKKYELYNDKICMGDEAAECRQSLKERIESIGYVIADVRGDYGEHNT